VIPILWSKRREKRCLGLRFDGSTRCIFLAAPGLSLGASGPRWNIVSMRPARKLRGIRYTSDLERENLNPWMVVTYLQGVGSGRHEVAAWEIGRPAITNIGIRTNLPLASSRHLRPTDKAQMEAIRLNDKVFRTLTSVNCSAHNMIGKEALHRRKFS
jgi:hypothetical protein